MRNQREELAYQTALEKAGEKVPEEEANFVYFRDQWVGSPYGKINLFSLINGSAFNKPLYQTAREYIERMYGSLFHIEKSKDLSKQILDGIIKTQQECLKKNVPLLPLFQIAFENPSLQEIYYKMVRGTNTFYPEAPQGYLPLEDMITFTQTNTQPINFQYINILFLKTLFGEKAAQAIIEKELEAQYQGEKSKGSYALKEEGLKELLRVHNISNLNRCSLLNFQKFHSALPISWTDPQTNITVKLGLE